MKLRRGPRKLLELFSDANSGIGCCYISGSNVLYTLQRAEVEAHRRTECGAGESDRRFWTCHTSTEGRRRKNDCKRVRVTFWYEFIVNADIISAYLLYSVCQSVGHGPTSATEPSVQQTSSLELSADW